MKTIKTLLTNIKEQFTAQGIENPVLDARLVMQEVLNITHEEILLNNNRVITANESKALSILVSRRLKREPISRILGKRAFWKHEFKLSDKTLDPRPDSETIIQSVISSFNKNDELNILDLGTGTGCLLLSILNEFPNSKGVGVDISSGAIDIAKENAKEIGISKKVNFIDSDWKNMELNNSFNVIISNPPYIENSEIESLEPEVKNFDPYLALAGGNDGLDSYKEIIKILPKLLKKDGKIFFEIGYNQEVPVKEMLAHNGFSVIEVTQDLAGISRCIVAKWG